MIKLPNRVGKKKNRGYGSETDEVLPKMDRITSQQPPAISSHKTNLRDYRQKKLGRRSETMATHTPLGL